MDPELTFKTAEEEAADIHRRRVRTFVTALLIVILILIQVAISFAQNAGNTFTTPSTFRPEIKESTKINDQPDIKDTVKRISNIKYGIQSNPLFPKYQVQKIDAAKMQNEPLPKLYHALLKAGYGPIYNMPYGEFFINNTRSRDMAYGAHLKHLSSSGTLDSTGNAGWSDNNASIYGKKFYKKHTLTGDLNYVRNVIHYYGYNTNTYSLTPEFTRQRYQLIEPKLVLQSHYTDSTHTNHTIGLSYYNLQNLHNEVENNIKASADLSTFLNKEKVNLGISTDFYNHKQSSDTLNDLIISLAPSFEAGGKKWKAVVGLKGTIDNFKGKTRFYGFPQLNVEYDVYESMVIPYVGATGGLIKNSLRSLSNENPFIRPSINYVNTNNKYKLFAGLKGNLSSNTSYDVGGSYAQMDSLYFYNIDYSASSFANRFDVLYDNASVVNVNGALHYQVREKMHFIAKGNYYLYKTKTLTRAFHKPDYDLTLSAIYNLKSKIILRGDVFAIGKQWANSGPSDGSKAALVPKQIDGLVDVNLEAEYRYSKMLSFFVRANNIANQRYYRWERYPSQRFNFMVGVTFVPF
jgi:hypothetical protein